MYGHNAELEYAVNFSSKLKSIHYDGFWQHTAFFLLNYDRSAIDEHNVIDLMEQMSLWIDVRWNNNVLLGTEYILGDKKVIDMVCVNSRKPKKEYAELFEQFFAGRMPYLCKAEPSCIHMAMQLYYYCNELLKPIKTIDFNSVIVQRKFEYSHVSAACPNQTTNFPIQPVFNPS